MHKLRWLRAPLALTLAFAAVLPPLRGLLEASMSAQMLLQFPWLLACGFVLAGTLPRRWHERVDAVNAYGITGLLLVAVTLSVLMIPRVLDLALVDARIEAAKALALLACGAALRLSWQRAGLLVQGFFLGNVLPMTAAVGQLYEDSPLRLCNAYLRGDQVWLGQALVVVAVATGAGWLAQLFVVLYRREALGALPEAADRLAAGPPRGAAAASLLAAAAGRGNRDHDAGTGARP